MKINVNHLVIQCENYWANKIIKIFIFIIKNKYITEYNVLI